MKNRAQTLITLESFFKLGSNFKPVGSGVTGLFLPVAQQSDTFVCFKLVWFCLFGPD